MKTLKEVWITVYKLKKKKKNTVPYLPFPKVRKQSIFLNCVQENHSNKIPGKSYLNFWTLWGFCSIVQLCDVTQFLLEPISTTHFFFFSLQNTAPLFKKILTQDVNYLLAYSLFSWSFSSASRLSLSMLLPSHSLNWFSC